MPYKFSPSSLSLLKECPKCFWLRFNKEIRRPSTIFPSLPGGMDKILKEYFDLSRAQGKIPKELPDDVELFQDMELLKQWRDSWRGIRFVDKEGNIFMGAVDEILKKGDKLIVLDYKTRGYPLKDDTHTYYEDQLNIYSWLLKKNGYEIEDYSYLLFYYPVKVSGQNNIFFQHNLVKMPVNLKKAEDIFKNALETLKGKMPESSETCGFCRWAKSF
ncbi:PD-(D/E)XK nuclease family protein [Nanoarchaeota archaeon]